MRVHDQQHSEIGEREPLLRDGTTDGGEQGESKPVLRFEDGDSDNPRNWSHKSKMINVAVIAIMGVLSPLASSMFTPGIDQIAEGLQTTKETVIGCTTGYVVMLGIGPLVVAPFSETFGRRPMYLSCFTIFTLLQIPSALSPNIETLIAMRTLAGFFGSVGVANGGGSISDMFQPGQRASIFGWYLLGSLLGPTIGPLFGGVIVQRLGWRWIFWILAIVCAANTLTGFLFLAESYAPAVLDLRRRRLEKEEGAPHKYRLEDEDTRPLYIKLLHSLTRPPRILMQPIVLTMSTYMAIIFATTYSIYTNMQPIFQGDYGFNTEQVGLTYLGPGLGCLTAVWFLVPKIDTVYNKLTEKHDGKPCPEFRLPLANIGAVSIPIGLFVFAWTVQYHVVWPVPLLATFLYGVGQVTILNTTQNYYIDCFEKYAASAVAAGTVFRSIVGGIVPLFAPALFDKLGYGWGISVFAFVSVAIAPAPLTFYFQGQKVRERYQIKF